jgi:phosphoglucomutase
MPAQSPVRVTKKEPDIYDIDLEAIRSAGVKIGVDPLGGAAAA